jgi:hypothetical protein
MKTIRTNCFETNSSSTHSVTIDNSYSEKENTLGYVIEPGEFGWEYRKFNDFATKASYFWTLAQNDQWAETRVGGCLNKRMHRLAKEHDFALMIPQEGEWNYVDHGWEHYADITEKHPSLLTDEGLFDFLVSKGAWIMLGNDNSYDEPNFRLTPNQIAACKRHLVLAEDRTISLAIQEKRLSKQSRLKYARLASDIYFERHPHMIGTSTWDHAWPHIIETTDSTVTVELRKYMMGQDTAVATKTLNYTIESK